MSLAINRNSDQVLDEATTLQVIQDQIYRWSTLNFGNNESKVEEGLVLGSLLSLMGCAEEFFEYGENDILASLTPNTHPEHEKFILEDKDAIADQAIYLLDYCARMRYSGGLLYKSAINEEWLPDCKGSDEALEMLCMSRGFKDLFHSTIKAHQGIRGFDNPILFRETQERGIRYLFAGLHLHMENNHAVSLLDIIKETWGKVMKRDWNKNPQDAHKLGTAIPAAEACQDEGSEPLTRQLPNEDGPDPQAIMDDDGGPPVNTGPEADDLSPPVI